METAPALAVIPKYPTPMADNVTMEDVGGGQITVTATGGFLTGTRLRIGSTTLGDSSPNFSASPTNLQFTVPAISPSLSTPKLVNRDGTEVELLQQDITVAAGAGGPAICTGPIPGRRRQCRCYGDQESEWESKGEGPEACGD